MYKFLKNNRHFLLVGSLIIIAFIVFYGRFGDINVDSFREAYIPQQILAGKLLYKNIFTIYAPFAYLFNALLFLIFGIKLKVLYLAGLFTTLGIFYFIQKLSTKLLNPLMSLAVQLVLIAALVLSPNVFSPFFPYSYGILYGLFFILASVYFAMYRKFPVSYFFYSLAILSKYEFILLLPLLIYISRRKDLKKNLLAFFIPVFAVIAALHGTSLNDIFTSLALVFKMSSAKTLLWFYSAAGLTFRLELIPIYIINIIKFIIPVWWVKYQEIFTWAFPLILIIFAFRFNSFGRKEKFFIAASLLISVKVFFALTIQSYGVFFLPFALISLGIITPEKLKKTFTCLLIIWALVIGGFNTKELLAKNYKIKTDRGIIRTRPVYGQGASEVINYLKNTDKNATVLVYPEGLSINFLANRKSDDKFYSLIPLYVETFGENIIIKRLEITKPDYIIINNYDTSAYYFKTFGQDYAASVREWILDNYVIDKTIATGLNYKIFIRRH